MQAQDRVLGLDLASWQGNISQTTWNNLKTIDNRDFVFLRSSRGGTTGFYNQSNPGNNNPPGQNTLSQRYDDHYFVQNITRATAAGLYAGPYHFARPDIIASTLNSGGIANTGVDEADHFMQMAGAWMRPGYLLPTFDLEAGDAQRTPTQLAQYSIDFSDRIFETYGIRPIIYTNGNYASILQATSSATEDDVIERFPYLWSARPAYGTNSGNNVPESVATPAVLDPSSNPKDTFSAIYGPWDDSPLPTHPWSFWQYKWTLDTVSYSGNLDGNVANGGTEFLKDHLVPALWTSSSGGDWSTLTNWNSGQTPVAPVQGPGQTPRVGALTLPAVRLPSVDDTVILERANEDISVTVSSGSHSIRKLYVREDLNIDGGVLNVNYVPSSDSTPNTVEVSAALTLTDGVLTAHTLQVDPSASLALAGGLFSFDTLSLQRDPTNPSDFSFAGDVWLNPITPGTVSVVEISTASGSPPVIDLGGAMRQVRVGLGASDEVVLEPAVVNGALEKVGAGKLTIAGSIGYNGETSVKEGILGLDNAVLPNSGDVAITTGGLLELDFVGADSIASLMLDGVAQSPGTWGAPGSGADFTTPLISGSGLLLVTESPVLGDLTNDGFVDAADLSLWELAVQFGDPLAGDADGDLDTDLADLIVIQREWTGVPAVQTVPEPSSLLLFAAIIAVSIKSIDRHSVRR
ncbi:MAG: glycoside hydrolase family 25 protein [Planctomycetota bacterium]